MSTVGLQKTLYDDERHGRWAPEQKRQLLVVIDRDGWVGMIVADFVDVPQNYNNLYYYKDNITLYLPQIKDLCICCLHICLYHRIVLFLVTSQLSMFSDNASHHVYSQLFLQVVLEGINYLRPCTCSTIGQILLMVEHQWLKPITAHIVAFYFLSQ